jgi:acyl-CoA reductase-like NAD-dependent aldehyde dehydrogenase
MLSAQPSVTAGSFIECHDPATLEPLGKVAAMGAAEVRERVLRARAAQPAWGATSFAERRAVLRGVLERVLARQDEICRLSARDSGKTLADGVMGEVIPVCEKLRWTIANGERWLRPERRSPGLFLHKTARVEYRPLGVIGIICPWNYPFHNIACPTVPALFAGNGVVLKVSEHTSFSAEAYVEIFRDALQEHGHSPELVQLVTGYGDSGAALVRSGADKIFFTGSPANGRKVMATASEAPTPVVLELGGKDPMIVCDDANLEQAIGQAMLGVFSSAGQMCVGVERVYVFADVYDAFVERALEEVQALRQGPPLGESVVDIGAMTMPRQLDIIQELVDDAVARGARVLTGGRRNPALRGQFYEPTLIVDVDHSMRISQEEQFGPVLVVLKVQGEEEAVRLANDTRYGLGASVFTRDRKRGDRIASKIRAGMVVVNDYGIAAMTQSLPFGGEKISGVDRINGPEGLRGCCHVQAVMNDRFPWGAGVSLYPIQATTFPLVANVARVIFSPSLKGRARAAVAAARLGLAELRSRRGSSS